MKKELRTVYVTHDTMHGFPRGFKIVGLKPPLADGRVPVMVIGAPGGHQEVWRRFVLVKEGTIVDDDYLKFIGVSQGLKGTVAVYTVIPLTAEEKAERAQRKFMRDMVVRLDKLEKRLPKVDEPPAVAEPRGAAPVAGPTPVEELSDG